MNEFTPPLTAEECRQKASSLSKESRHKLIIERDREEARTLNNLAREYLDYGKEIWPDEFDSNNYARVKDPKDPHYQKVGRVGYWSHNSGDVHFKNGEKGNYHSMSLEKVKPSDYYREKE